MNVNDIYELCKFIVDKNQNGYLKPVDFNRVINVGMRSWIAWILGDFQQYTPGRPIARVELGNNEIVRQRLTPCIYGYILNVHPIYGTSPYPGDYIQTDTMYSIYGVKRIRYADNDKLDAYYNSVIDPIATNPIYLIEDINFQFYPISVWKAKLRYVRDPSDIHWGFTENINGKAVYDPATSVDPIFDNMVIMEIIVRALRLVGINLQVAAVIQYADEIKTQGQ